MIYAYCKAKVHIQAKLIIEGAGSHILECTCKAPIKRCVIVDDSARAHFHPNYHQLSSTIMLAVKREKLSSTIITILNMYKASDS